jgi:cobalt-zinc-cadmium efflux system protein
MAQTQKMQEHTEAKVDFRRLQIYLVILLLIMAAEVVGGLLSGSLALLSDAGHMLVDALALILSLLAITVARRPATATKTFGYHRWEILAALANGTFLILVSVYIFYEAYQRYLHPPEIKTPLMLIIAVIGLAANLGGVLLLNSSSHRSLNVKAAFWHVIGDTVSSVGVIIAGIVISITGLYVADTIAAFLIGCIIIWGAVRIVNEASDILLEAVPKNMEIGTVIEAIKRLPGVKEVHDVHIWTITSDIFALSAHIEITDQMVSKSVDLVNMVRREMAERFNIGHTTLQLECDTCPSGLVCELDKSDPTAPQNHHQMS